MCLKIKLDQKQNKKDLKKWFGNRKKFAYVYKILEKECLGHYISVFRRNFAWDFNKQKVYQVDRPSKPTQIELEKQAINKGLHVYTSLKAAKIYKICACDVIVKFRVRREDIVAVDNNRVNKKYNLTQAVCRRLEFVKVLKEN
jgi:hypothetical protein